LDISIYAVAKVDLNNLIRPKQQNNPSTVLSKKVEVVGSIYTDLHLDLQFSKSIGVGTSPANSNDILVDSDEEAIKNSIRNIFSIRKGDKLLNPEFGSSLEQYLFEPVSEVYARAIADDILNTLETYEPRIEVTKVTIVPKQDDNQYETYVRYRFLEIQKESILSIIAKRGGEILI
jgi:phage baseplate assembly protein W